MSKTIGYVLGTKSESFFVKPSFESWSLSSNIHEATIFLNKQDVKEMWKTIDYAVFTTYWDWSDIPPEPLIYKLYHDGKYKKLKNVDYDGLRKEFAEKLRR